jgi:hypothetical protein
VMTRCASGSGALEGAIGVGLGARRSQRLRCDRPCADGASRRSTRGGAALDRRRSASRGDRAANHSAARAQVEVWMVGGYDVIWPD